MSVGGGLHSFDLTESREGVEGLTLNVRLTHVQGRVANHDHVIAAFPLEVAMGQTAAPPRQTASGRVALLAAAGKINFDIKTVMYFFNFLIEYNVFSYVAIISRVAD